MKSFLISTIFCLSVSMAMAVESDTSRIFRMIGMDIGDCQGYYYMDENRLLFFDSPAVALKEMELWKCERPEIPADIDFGKEDIFLIDYYGVDCNSNFDFYAVIDTVVHTYTFVSRVTYGGCRAGGNYFHSWAVVPKVPPGYKVHYARELIDRVAGKREFIIEKTYSKN